MVDGIAAATFFPGDTPGRATLSATTGEITVTTVVEIQYTMPNLQVTKIVTPLRANPGDTLTYTLDFANVGGSIATGVVITDLLPSALRNPTVISRGAIITPRLDSLYVWDVIDLASGETGAITITAQVSPTFTGLLTNTATIVSGEVSVATDASVTRIITTSDSHTVYLPVAMSRSFGQPTTTELPDLVVQELVVTTDDVRVAIKNEGIATVTEGFWIDVYINPTSVPTAVNQIWSDLGEEGLVWGVKSPIRPEDILIVAVGDSSFRNDLSQVTWPLALGTPIYAQVDSWCADTLYGAVLEDHEHAGTPYENNIDRTTVQRKPVGATILSGKPVKSRQTVADLPWR
jgi:uncharacterized repeat protein (TIGR01451 family)